MPSTPNQWRALHVRDSNWPDSGAVDRDEGTAAVQEQYPAAESGATEGSFAVRRRWRGGGGKMTPGKKRQRSSRSWNAFKVLATSAGQRPLPTGQIQEQVACQLVKTRRKSGKSIGHRQILWNSDRKQEDRVRWSTLLVKIKRSFSVPREDTCLTLPRQSKTVPFPPGEIP